MTTRQRTLAAEVQLEGVGVHSGAPIRVAMKPAAPRSGIVFVRTDLPDAPEIPGSADAVVDTTLATTLGRGDVRIGTVEHIIAACAGLGVNNVRIELDGPEIPILDGSSAPFVEQLLGAGFVEQSVAREVVVVRRPVVVSVGEKRTRLLPVLDGRFRVTYMIDFDHPVIGRQVWDGFITPTTFATELAPARTFGFLRDVERLKAAGLARGASLENAVALDDAGVINPEGLRFPDEFVRHKALDAVGDLALAGYPMAGHLVAELSGHDMNQQLVRALLGDPRNYALVPADAVLDVPVQAVAV